MSKFVKQHHFINQGPRVLTQRCTFLQSVGFPPNKLAAHTSDCHLLSRGYRSQLYLNAGEEGIEEGRKVESHKGDTELSRIDSGLTGQLRESEKKKPLATILLPGYIYDEQQLLLVWNKSGLDIK